MAGKGLLQTDSNEETGKIWGDKKGLLLLLYKTLVLYAFFQTSMY